MKLALISLTHPIVRCTMLSFPLEYEYGYRNPKKQRRKQRIGNNHWWHTTDAINCVNASRSQAQPCLLAR